MLSEDFDKRDTVNSSPVPFHIIFLTIKQFPPFEIPLGFTVPCLIFSCSFKYFFKLGF